MLHWIKIKNFGPFNEEIKLNFTKTKAKNNALLTRHIDGENILKSVAIFGKNGAGKSAIMHAINFVRECFMSGSTNNRFNQNDKPFEWLNYFSNAKFSKIEFKISTKNNTFTYQINFNTNIIAKESLNLNKGNKNIVMLERKNNIVSFTDKKGEIHKLKITPTTIAVSDLAKIQNYVFSQQISDFLHSVLEIRGFSSFVPGNNVSFIINSISRKIQNSIEKGLLKGYKNVEEFFHLRVNPILSKVDLNCDQFILLKSKNLKKPNEFIYYVQAVLPKELENDNISNKTFILSTGTLEMIVISFFIAEALLEGKVLFVDELASHTHPKLIDLILELIHSPQIKTNSQFIFNTNQISLINSIHYDQQIFLDNYKNTGVKAKTLKVSETRNRSVYKNFYEGNFFGSPNFDLSIKDEILKKA